MAEVVPPVAELKKSLEQMAKLQWVTLPPVWLPLVEYFWHGDPAVNPLQWPHVTDCAQLPPGLRDEIQTDVDAALLQICPSFALAVPFLVIGRKHVGNLRAGPVSFQEGDRYEIRKYTELLLVEAVYLGPALRGDSQKLPPSAVIKQLGDEKWLKSRLGETPLAKKIAKNVITHNTYYRWLDGGIKTLHQALNSVMKKKLPPEGPRMLVTLPPIPHDAAASVSPQPPTGLEPAPLFPPLPRLRIERQPLADISAALRHPHYRAIILYGGAGMGKTTLAGQVVRAPEIQAAFPGGIAWASGAGSVEEIAAAWGTDLHFKREDHSSWTQCWRQQGADTGKMLLVLDDVVTLPDLKGLFEGVDPNAVVLLTTQFGQEIWEAVARNWLEPELIWGIQIGPFSPAEARALVEQAQRRPLTDEEWEVVANLELLSEGDPQYLGRVALHSNLAEWQALLAELRVAPEALHSSIQRVRTQWERLEHTPFRAYTETLAACMLEPRPFGTLYAAAVWRVTPEIAARRLEEQARLGLVQALEFHDPMGLIPKLWHLPKPVQGCLALTAPPSFNPDPDRRRRQGVARQRAKLARTLLHYAGPAWRAPWQFQLLGIPWMLAAVLWEPWGWLWRWAGTALGPRAPRNWRSLWQRWWLAGAEYARVETFKQHGAHVPLEYQCLTDAASDIGNVFLRGAALIFVGFVVLALYGLSLAPASRSAFFNSAGFQYTWLVLLLGLSLWSFTRITHIFWLLYRMGLDYPPLHWLARAARRLGMREPARV